MQPPFLRRVKFGVLVYFILLKSDINPTFVIKKIFYMEGQFLYFHSIQFRLLGLPNANWKFHFICFF